MEQAIMMEATLVAPTRSNGDGLLAAHKEHSNRSKELFSVQDWHVQCFRGVMGEFVWTFEQQPHGMWEGVTCTILGCCWTSSRQAISLVAEVSGNLCRELILFDRNSCGYSIDRTR